MLPMGTVDVYPGVYGGPYGGSQPGCFFAAMWPGGQLCSHFRYLPILMQCKQLEHILNDLALFFRAPEMFIATIKDNGLCQASRTCGGEPLTCSQAAGDNVKLGYWMSDQTSGSFAIDTSANFPFCA